MRVLEIGAGEFPGPIFDNSDIHIALDIEHFTDDKFKRITADATSMPMQSRTIDIVLARNVFGDPFLGVPEERRGSYHNRLFANKFESHTELNSIVDDIFEANIRKTLIINEIARVLRTNGKLIIIEQYTPDVASEFIDSNNCSLFDDLVLNSASLESVTPANYHEFHNRIWKPKAWVGRPK